MIERNEYLNALKSWKDQDEVDKYLDSIYNTIIVKDIAIRKKIADISMFRSVCEFMFSSVGNVLSVKKIDDTLTSNGRSISVHTVESYLDSLVESFVFNKVSRYDIKENNIYKVVKNIMLLMLQCDMLCLKEKMLI